MGLTRISGGMIVIIVYAFFAVLFSIILCTYIVERTAACGDCRYITHQVGYRGHGGGGGGTRT